MLDSPHTTLSPPIVAAGRDRALDRLGVLVLICSITLLLGIAGAAVWQAARNDVALTEAKATRVQRDAATKVLIAALDAETTQRGYLLTADVIGLGPLNRAEQAMPGLLAKLDADLATDPRMIRLHQAITAKFAELQQTAMLAQNGRQADAMAIVRTNAGSMNMQVIRSTIADLNAEQDARLAAQVVTVSRGSSLLVVIDAAGLAMVLALAGLFAVGLRRTLATLRNAQARTARAYETVAQNNAMLDDTVRRRTAALTSANEEIQRFAYIVSHDLRAPLVNIMGFTSELEQSTILLTRHVMAGAPSPDIREAVAEEIPEALRFIKSSTQKMDRLINAILRLSREGRRVLTPERLDMAALLTGLTETMRHQADASEAAVAVGPVPDIESDRLAVEQVFGNIIENALKYLDPGRPGRIEVTGRIEGSTARFEITDNGRGIAGRDFERIFELFRRAGDQTVRGEGIGLAHVRALVRRLGGSVDCTSKLGAGSVFIICLPAAASYDREEGL